MYVPHASSAWPAVRFEEIDSTNEEARRRVAGGDIDPCWLVADRQSAGRGRLGRAWSSPTGNLYATASFVVQAAPAEAALICFAAGLAVIDAAASAGVWSQPLALKWPNDVLLGPAKLAGILIETTQAQGALAIAAGFGVNVAHHPNLPDRPTASLAELQGATGLSAAVYLTHLDIAFRARLMELASEGFEPIRQAWLERAAHLGKPVSVNLPGGPVSGMMQELASDGALVIATEDGRLHHVRAGEISLLD